MYSSFHYKKSFYRSRRKGKILGICAGLAERYDWDVSILRIAAVLSLIFFTAPTLVAYIITSLLTDSI